MLRNHLTRDDHGQKMSLKEFDRALRPPGQHYELAHGTIAAGAPPTARHEAIVAAVRSQLETFDQANPGNLYCVAGSDEARIVLYTHDSERHPDLAVYRTPPPETGPELSALWAPEIIVEVVSPETEYVDYVDKCEEYLQFGAAEYWVIDDARRELLFHRRSGGRWAEETIRASQRCSTRLLPGFSLSLARLFGPPKPATPPAFAPR